MRIDTRGTTLKLTGLVLTGLLLTASGCGPTGALLAMTMPDTEKVPPEYSKLSGRTVLVHVYALPEIRWEYEKVTLDLAAYLSEYLQQNVKGVNVVDYLRVAAHMEKTPESENDPVGVGKQFNADMVVQVSVHKLSVRDPGMAHFYRGRLAASVVVYDMTGPNELPERTPLQDVEVAVPEEGAVGVTNVTASQMRQQTYIAFTTAAGKKFHEHERPIK